MKSYFWMILTIISLYTTGNITAQADSETYYKQGLQHFTQSKFVDAITAFNSAIELKPNEAKYYLAKGQAQLELGLYERAIESLDEAIALDPNFALAYWYRSETYYASGDIPEAVVDYDRAVELDPSYADFYERLAFNYAAIGDEAQYFANRNHSIDLKNRFVSAFDQAYRLEIKRVREVSVADGDRPKNGAFLILETQFYNYTSEPICFTKHAVKATSNEVVFEPEKLYQVRQQYYHEMDYISADKPKCIQPYSAFNTFLAYDLASNLTDLTLDFQPNEASSLKFTLWLNKDPEGEYEFALAEINGEEYAKVVNIETVETIESIHDSHLISVENCFGTTDRKSQVSYTMSQATSIEDETVTVAQGGVKGMPLPIPYLNKIIFINLGIENRSRTIEGEVYNLLVTVTEEVGAAPGTHANYQVTWVSVNVTGTAEMIVGDNTFFISFTVENRIRGKVETLPPTPCE